MGTLGVFAFVSGLFIALANDRIVPTGAKNYIALRKFVIYCGVGSMIIGLIAIWMA